MFTKQQHSKRTKNMRALALPRFQRRQPSTSNVLQDAVEKALQKIDEELNSIRDQLRVVERTAPRKRKRVISAGFGTLRMIKRTLDDFKMMNQVTKKMEPMRRYEVQKEMHDKMLETLTPVVFGDDWNRNRISIADELKIDTNPNPVLMINAPRRYGKSAATGQMAASLLVNRNGIKVGAFSVSSRASMALLKMTHTLMLSLGPEFDRRVLTVGRDRLAVLATPLPASVSRRSDFARKMIDHPMTSQFYAWPDGTKSLRGVTVDVVLLEEAAFIRPITLQTVAFPLLGVDGTVAIGISTPGGEDSYLADMFDRKDEKGNPIFEVLDFAHACRECSENGKAPDCTHVRKRLPPWKSNARLKRSKYWIQDSTVNQRENMGLRVTSQQCMYKRALVAALFTRRLKPRSFDIISIGIDPAGGGPQSDFVIMSIGYTPAQDVILGIDRTDSIDPDDVAAMIADHTSNLIDKPYAENAKLVAIIEANMSWIDAKRMRNGIWTVVMQKERTYARTNARLHVMTHTSGKDTITSSKQNGRYGVFTSEYVKFASARLLRTHMKNERLAFANSVFGVNAEKSMIEMREQCLRYRREKGKLTGKGFMQKDDMVVLLHLTLFWTKVYLGEESAVTPKDFDWEDKHNSRGQQHNRESRSTRTSAWL